MAISDQIARLTSLRNDFRSKFIDIGLLPSASISATFSDCYSVLSSVSGLGASSYTPTSSAQVIPSGTYLNGAQTIEAIPSSYVIPTGTITLSQSGTFDVASYASANVTAAGGGGIHMEYSVYSTDFTQWQIARTLMAEKLDFANSSIEVPANLLYSGMISPKFTIVNASNVSIIRPFAFYMTHYSYGLIPSNSSDYIFDKIEEVFPNLTTIGSNAFYAQYGQANLFQSTAELNFSKVIEIGSSAFVNQKIRSVSFAALSSCNGLNGGGALEETFAQTTYLISVYFPELSYVSIARSAFAGCTKLTTVSFPKLTSIGYGSGMFNGCINLEYVNFPSLQYITEASNMFRGCSILKQVEFPELIGSSPLSTQTMNMNYTFVSDSMLQSISFPKFTGQINLSYAFSRCFSLSYVDLGSARWLYGASAFTSCSLLISVYLRRSDGVCGLGSAASGVFAGTPIYGNSATAGRWGSIFVPASLVDSYKTSTNWTVVSQRITSIV